MTVRAKFKVSSITRTQGSEYNPETKSYDPAEQQTIKLTPVYDSDPNSENGKFYASTPSGHIELGVLNAEAGNQFQLNQDFYVDFIPANPS